MLLLLCVMSYFHLPVEYMDVEWYLLIVGSILSGIGIRECMCIGKCREATCENLFVGENVQEDWMEAEGMEQLQEVPKQVKFIDNPMPLPKKHVKKAIEYSVEPPEELMDFDIEISEEDDFDL